LAVFSDELRIEAGETDVSLSESRCATHEGRVFFLEVGWGVGLPIVWEMFARLALFVATFVSGAKLRGLGDGLGLTAGFVRAAG